jgi:hypothetical protein
MKIAFWTLALLLTGMVVWLAFGQRQLRREARDLQAQNQALQQQLTQRPASSAERDWQLEEMRVNLIATDARLTNLLAQVAALQNTRTPAPQFRPERTAAVQEVDAFPQLEPASRPPSSSHSPAGELLNRNWGPEQVLGPSNTDQSGDIVTAWASARPDGGEEWLHANYDQLVDIGEVRIRETYNPGAISKITAFLPNGQEVTIWEGTEPMAEAPVDTSFTPMSRVQAKSVKVYMDTRRVPGWNEVDSIELIGRDGTRQWAKSATASSTYAER